jgi:hypothetical protein
VFVVGDLSPKFVVGALAPHASNKPLHGICSPSNKNARAIQHEQVYDVFKQFIFMDFNG